MIIVVILQFVVELTTIKVYIQLFYLQLNNTLTFVKRQNIFYIQLILFKPILNSLYIFNNCIYTKNNILMLKTSTTHTHIYSIIKMYTYL